jgi:hypothetical protein
MHRNQTLSENPDTQGGERGAPPKGKPMSAANIVGSVLSAAFGVQSSRNRERDFSQGSYRQFIIAGLIFTILFITTLVVVVRMVLSGR